MEVAQVSAEFSADNSQIKAKINETKRDVDGLQKHIEGIKLQIQPPDVPKAKLPVLEMPSLTGHLDNVAVPDFGKKIEDEAGKASEATKKISMSAGDALAGIQKLTGLGTKAFRQLTIGAAAVSAAVGMISKSALSIGSGFESQMARVQAISGATGEQFAQLSARARELGAALPITARDAGAAMEVLAQRGASVSNILGTAGDIINLSISQQYGLAESADAVSAAMLNFGMSADKTAQIVDAFNNASNQSALSMSSLGGALTYVAPNANALGMDLYETVAAMEALANAGFSGYRIGTGLTDVLSSLAAPTEKAAATLSGLGIRINDVSGKMRPFKDLMLDLRDANISYEDSVAIFGVAGAKYGQVLAQNSGQLADNERNLKKTGSTARNVAIQMETLANKWNAFKSASEETKITAFDQAKGQVKGLVDQLAELSRSMGVWIGKTKVAERSVGAFFRGLGIGDGTISGLAARFDDLLALNIEMFFDRAGAAIRGVSGAISAFASAVPWDLIIANLDLIAKAAFWGMILDKGVRIASGISNIGEKLGELPGMAQAAGSALSAVGNEIVSFAESSAGASSVIASLGKALSAFGSIAVGAGAAAVGVGAALGLLTVQSYKLAAARRALRDAERGGREEDQNRMYAQMYIRVLQGEIDLLDQMPDKYRDLYNAKKKAEADEGKLAVSDRLKRDYDEAKITFEEYMAELEKLNKAASAADYASLKAAEDFKTRYEEILNKAKSGKITDQKAAGLTVKLMAEFDKKGFDLNYNRLIKEAREKAARDPVNMSRAFSFEDLKPRVEKEAEGVVAALDAKLAGAERAFGRGSAAFGAAAKEAFAEAVKSADEFADGIAKDYGPAGAISVANYFREMGYAGSAAFARIAGGMKGAEAQLEAVTDSIAAVKDRMKYLGENPAGMVKWLEELLKKTPKLDEATGEVNKQYKILIDQLNELKNMSLSNLETQVKGLGQAVQDGFIDSKALTDRVKKLLPELEKEIRAGVERDFAGSGAKEKEAVYRSRMQEYGQKSGVPELAKALRDYLAKLPNMDYGSTSTFNDKGYQSFASLGKVWDDAGSGVKSASEGIKALGEQSVKTSEKMKEIRPGDANRVPSAPGVIPQKQIVQIDQATGSAELANVSAATDAIKELAAEIRGLSGKLGGAKDGGVSQPAPDELMAAIRQGGASIRELITSNGTLVENIRSLVITLSKADFRTLKQEVDAKINIITQQPAETVRQQLQSYSTAM